MKIINYLYYILLVILIFFAVNFYIKMVTIPMWFIVATLAAATIIFFIRMYTRFGRH